MDCQHIFIFVFFYCQMKCVGAAHKIPCENYWFILFEYRDSFQFDIRVEFPLWRWFAFCSTFSTKVNERKLLHRRIELLTAELYWSVDVDMRCALAQTHTHTLIKCLQNLWFLPLFRIHNIYYPSFLWSSFSFVLVWKKKRKYSLQMKNHVYIGSNATQFLLSEP